MNEPLQELIEALAAQHSLSEEEYARLISQRTPEAARLLAQYAVKARKEIYGNAVFIRGLVEISNICKSDCLYCGIRRSNRRCERYRLTPEDILQCCREGYRLGFRTFVLQGGEDGIHTDEMLCQLISAIKGEFPQCALTLSLGERSKRSYQALFDAGADRYLLRHETADRRIMKSFTPQVSPSKTGWRAFGI